MTPITHLLLISRFRSLWRTILLGQLLSVLMCSFQYVSHHLSTTLALTIFTSQNYLRYMATCCVFTTMLAFRHGDKSLFNVIKTRGYRYILIGLVDLEANTLVGMSHQFSSLINIQVGRWWRWFFCSWVFPSFQFLHCVSLPVSIILSCLTLGVRFRLVHMIGVSICLMGIAALVSAGIGGAAVEGRDGKWIGEVWSRKKFKLKFQINHNRWVICSALPVQSYSQ